jgi:ABC-type uncharacterized transport system permease subunit
MAPRFVYATPLILAGLGVGLGFKAGLFNIGGRGQFLMGTIGAMAVVTLIGACQNGSDHDPAGAGSSAALFGASPASSPGALKATSGAHEVVTTIMLNYVFVFVTYWAISGPLRLPNSPQPITGRTGTRGAPCRSSWAGRSRRHPAGSLGIPLIWFLLYRTTLGFEIRAAGANSDAARYAGMKTNASSSS